MTDHEPGCPLSAVPWLLQAEASAGAWGAPGPGRGGFADRAGVGALADALDRFHEMDIWAEARLSAALRQAAPPEDERRSAWCTCRRGPAAGSQR